LPSRDTLAEEYEGKIKVGKVNVDENPATPSKYRYVEFQPLSCSRTER
jgi:thioredoxin-like negative regulator of GroEL